MNPIETLSSKRPCKLNFDIFKNHIAKEYNMSEIIDGFKSSTPKIRKKNSKVTFSPSVKRHDGMCRHNQILDRHIFEISGWLGKTGIFQQMITDKNIKEIQILYNDILNLIERCKNSNTEQVPVIATGGGKSTFITRSVHLEPLIRHANYVLLKLNKLKVENLKLQ